MLLTCSFNLFCDNEYGYEGEVVSTEPIATLTYNVVDIDPNTNITYKYQFAEIDGNLTDLSL